MVTNLVHFQLKISWVLPYAAASNSTVNKWLLNRIYYTFIEYWNEIVDQHSHLGIKYINSIESVLSSILMLFRPLWFWLWNEENFKFVSIITSSQQSMLLFLQNFLLLGQIWYQNSQFVVMHILVFKFSYLTITLSFPHQLSNMIPFGIF